MYNKRIWLNDETKDSTGSVVAFDGLITDLDTGARYEQRFLEISDCRRKIRLHQSSDDSKEDFIKKMKLLHSTVHDFINHLEHKTVGRGSQLDQLYYLRSNASAAYRGASIYTILFDLVDGNGIDEVKNVLSCLASDLEL